MILDAVEGSILVPSLVSIADNLEQSTFKTQWLMSGFALGFAMLLPVGPALAARYGRRNVYLVAMACFAVASILGGLSGNLSVLVLTRVVKGAAAALTAPAGLAVIAEAFQAGSQRRRAISVYATLGAAGFTAGLLLSGLLEQVTWRLLFFLPGLVATLLLVAAWRVIPSASAEPLKAYRVNIFRNETLVRSTIGAAAINGGYIALILVLAIHLYGTVGWSTWQIGLGLLPASVPLIFSSLLTERLMAAFGSACLIFIGASVTVAGQLLWIVQADGDNYVTDILPVLLLVEAGFVLSFAALNTQAAAALSVSSRARGVSIYQTGVQAGAAAMLPVAVGLSAVLSSRYAAVVVLLAGMVAVVAAGMELGSGRNGRKLQ
ncbi:MFS transporter [Rhodococcus sp. IEGM 1330]|uniref:MFS transporter n=1 Tax=Rhodococcus sp. IEGM 1330 TaxID=3082225 RepID=UPI002953EFB2|nr:MFS transporter [Rhodococcus sp. IEGM 1330]MDV8022183.1 MFS transporter [Rhodococcus sp. IEGM 1330]